jgi:hypothetical protein
MIHVVAIMPAREQGVNTSSAAEPLAQHDCQIRDYRPGIECVALAGAAAADDEREARAGTEREGGRGSDAAEISTRCVPSALPVYAACVRSAERCTTLPSRLDASSGASEAEPG